MLYLMCVPHVYTYICYVFNVRLVHPFFVFRERKKLTGHNGYATG